MGRLMLWAMSSLPRGQADGIDENRLFFFAVSRKHIGAN